MHTGKNILGTATALALALAALACGNGSSGAGGGGAGGSGTTSTSTSTGSGSCAIDSQTCQACLAGFHCDDGCTGACATALESERSCACDAQNNHHDTVSCFGTTPGTATVAQCVAGNCVGSCLTE